MNRKRRERKFQVRDRVSLKKHKGIDGTAITDPLWTGPYRIARQVEENSYIFRMGRNESAENADQLKLALKAGDEYDWSVAGEYSNPSPQEQWNSTWLDKMVIRRPHEAQALDISAVLLEVNIRMPRQ